MTRSTLPAASRELQAGGYSKINGGVGSDTLRGGADSNLRGQDGNDVINVLGDDVLATGYAGHDQLWSYYSVRALR